MCECGILGLPGVVFDLASCWVSCFDSPAAGPGTQWMLGPSTKLATVGCWYMCVY